MILLKSPIKLSLFSDQIDKALNFSSKIDTNFYSSRNQFDIEKRKQDQFVGKLGEFAAFNYLNSINVSVSEPDCNLYSKGEKSWDYDLKSTDYNFHVKSQNVESARKFGISWTFQIGDDKIFSHYNDNDNDYVVFILIKNENEICICDIQSIKSLHENNCFSDPTVPRLIGIKKVVYFKKLKQVKNELISI